MLKAKSQKLKYLSETFKSHYIADPEIKLNTTYIWKINQVRSTTGFL